eukprot:COSAG03_NODE_290_length_9343_cov_30.055820_4_plen_63_part_00
MDWEKPLQLPRELCTATQLIRSCRTPCFPNMKWCIAVSLLQVLPIRISEYEKYKLIYEVDTL